MITREALRVLKNHLTAAKRIKREYNNKFGIEGAKIGTVLNVRKPPRYVVTEGQKLQLQDIKEETVPVVLDTQAHVGLTISSLDLRLNIDDFSKRILTPAVAALANKIDKKVCEQYANIANTVGLPGTVPNNLFTYLSAGVKLNDNATPMDGKRSMIISPLMEATLVNALQGLFQQASAIASQYAKGQMGTAAGFDFYMDQNVSTHTVGPLGLVPLVNGANQTGSSIVTNGWTAAAARRLNRGDVVQFAGVNGVNPQSYESTGVLQDFVVTANVDSDGAGNATIPIWPPIVTSGAEQTVDASPANTAAVTIFGDPFLYAGVQTRQGLALHEDSLTLVTADLPLFKGTDMAARMSDEDLGISMRLIRDYDISEDHAPTRIDVLFGVAALRPETACRVVS
jgi:hypothetical protein